MWVVASGFKSTSVRRNDVKLELQKQGSKKKIYLRATGYSNYEKEVLETGCKKFN